MCENPTIALGRAQWTYILFQGLGLSNFKFLLAQTSGGVSVALQRYPGPWHCMGVESACSQHLWVPSALAIGGMHFRQES